MVTCESPVNDSIPNLTDEQHEALREYTARHCHEETCSTAPVRLARVLAHDKPTTLIDTPLAIAAADAYFDDLLDRLECPYRQIRGHSGWIVASSAGRARLDLLPTVKTGNFSDAYHRRLGVVFGYPAVAIKHFIQKDDPGVTNVDLVQSGAFEATEVAYTKFVCYDYPKTQAKYASHISLGKAIRQRISRLARVWDLSDIDDLADEAYSQEVKYLKNGGGVPTSTPSLEFD
jgi:hypothetical protein